MLRTVGPALKADCVTSDVPKSFSRGGQNSRSWVNEFRERHLLKSRLAFVLRTKGGRKQSSALAVRHIRHTYTHTGESLPRLGAVRYLEEGSCHCDSAGEARRPLSLDGAACGQHTPSLDHHKNLFARLLSPASRLSTHLLTNTRTPSSHQQAGSYNTSSYPPLIPNQRLILCTTAPTANDRVISQIASTRAHRDINNSKPPPPAAASNGFTRAPAV